MQRKIVNDVFGGPSSDRKKRAGQYSMAKTPVHLASNDFLDMTESAHALLERDKNICRKCAQDKGQSSLHLFQRAVPDEARVVNARHALALYWHISNQYSVSSGSMISSSEASKRANISPPLDSE